MTQTLSIRDLRLDFQARENLSEGAVVELVALLRSGVDFAPVRVCFDGQNYFLEDGFHRVEAAKRLGRKEIQAEIREATLAQMEAEWLEHLKDLKSALREQ